MNSFIMAHKRRNSESSGGSGSSGSDLVSLGILEKQVSEFTASDIGTTVFIPYTDASNKILLNNGRIEFEVVGVNHHKDTNNEETPTITLMTKNIIRLAAFDAAEPDNTNSTRKSNGNNRWSVSNIRQWLNSSGAAGSWFTAQHEYDAPPISANVSDAAYADAPGFLAGFGANILQHFTDITNTTVLNSVDGGGSETTVDKVFLPSYTEMFGYGSGQGNHLSIKYVDDNSRIKQWNGSNYHYWTRTPNTVPASGGAAQVSVVRDDGTNIAALLIVAVNYGIAPIIVLH